MATYKALASLAYPDASGNEKRVQSGQTADDIPAKSVKWLLEQRLIEPIAAEEAK